MLLGTMTCCLRQLTEEEKRSNFLLCPLKSFTPQEKKLFLLAVLCDPFSAKPSIPIHDKDNITIHHEAISDNQYGLHHKSATSHEKYGPNAACSCERRLCQSNTEISTQSHMCEDSGDDSVSVVPIDTSANCDPGKRTRDSSTSDSTIFVPLPNIPSLLFQQTYCKWKAVMDNHLRLGQIRRRRTIYIQPIDDFPEFVHNSLGNDTDTICGANSVGFFELLREYMTVFFSGLNVIIRPTIQTTGNGWSVQSRYHHVTGKKQLLVGDIHKGLKKVLPKDGCCIVGVTWTDLYPSAELNFVLGEASMEHRCAAFCFGRYEPKCYTDGKEPAQMEEIDGFIIWKMLKVTCFCITLYFYQS